MFNNNVYYGKQGKSLLGYIGLTEGVIYRSPGNFNYMWSFGSIALFCLVIQIFSGIFLAMYYKADVMLAHNSVMYVMNEINLGWFVRYLHMNGASAFFLVVYLHIFRGLMANSYVQPRMFLWVSGVVILVIMILTAFFGYILPWGQMSFWAATVITSLILAIPLGGIEVELAEWIWGGFAVADATLNRFFSLHFFLPFVLLGLSIIHMLFLHEYGSTNPLGIWFKVDDVKLYPMYIVKDLIGILVISMFLGYLIFFNPNVLGHSDNYILANPLVTPSHIVPEWYFLPFYALLRIVTIKIIGVFFMVMAIVCLVLLPFTNVKIKSSKFKLGINSVVILFGGNWIILGHVGGEVPQGPYIASGLIGICVYFFCIILFFFYGYIENTLISLEYRLKNKVFLKRI